MKINIILFFCILFCSLLVIFSSFIEDKNVLAEEIEVSTVVIEHIESNIPNSDSYSSKTNPIVSIRNLKREFYSISFSIFKNLTKKYLISYQIISSEFHQVTLGFSFQKKSELWHTPIFIFFRNLRN